MGNLNRILTEISESQDDASAADMSEAA